MNDRMINLFSYWLKVYVQIRTIYPKDKSQDLARLIVRTRLNSMQVMFSILEPELEKPIYSIMYSIDSDPHQLLFDFSNVPFI